jgi:hypothetical protein
MTKPISEISASSRTAKVVAKVVAAMKSIDDEIERAGGSYPGRPSLNHVCRRAGVHPITMQGPAHKETTKPMIMAWLAEKRRTTTTTKRSDSASKSKRLRSTELDLRELAAHFRLRENEIPRMKEEIDTLQKRIAALERENTELRILLSNGVVTKMRKRG